MADWTHRDARITRALAAHGRAVIPMSLVCSPVSPDRPEAFLRWVVSALERAAATAPGSLGLSSPRRGDPGDRFAAARSFDQSSRRPSRQAGLRLESSAGW